MYQEACAYGTSVCSQLAACLCNPICAQQQGQASAAPPPLPGHGCTGFAGSSSSPSRTSNACCTPPECMLGFIQTKAEAVLLVFFEQHITYEEREI